MADLVRLGGRVVNLDNFCYSVPTDAGEVIYMTNGRIVLSVQETKLFMDEVDSRARAVRPVTKTAQNRRTQLLKQKR